MNFTIKGPEINIPEKISIRLPLLVIGSCFAENIGARLKQQLFDVNINPFGIVYNPLSIVQQLQRIIGNNPFTANELVEYNYLWHSWEHHGSFSDAEKETVLNNINSQFHSAHDKLKSAGWLIITLGSAYYYQLKENNKIVSNCHKVPAVNFTKQLASQQEITEKFQSLLIELKKLNPDLKVLFNVSPVRYTRDGLRENTISKSILHLAVAEITAGNAQCFYFPSYEIVIDELRDYRFYSEDMLHPNQLAIDYIYELFSNALFDDETKLIVKETRQWTTFSNHNILKATPKIIELHQLKMENMLQTLLIKYPFLSKAITSQNT